MLITTDLTKDEVWQEVVRRTRHNDGDFTDSEVRIINYYFEGGPNDKKIGRKRIPVKVTEPGGEVRRFKDAEECAKHYGSTAVNVLNMIWRGYVPSKGLFKGCVMEYD